MTNIDPELKFVSHGIEAYAGMRLEELTFCRLENYYGEIQDYKLDVITSVEKPQNPRPVVIFVHGGGFVQPHNKRQGYIPVFARSLTAAGYAVVSPDYPIFNNSDDRLKWNESRGADRAAEALHIAYAYIKENAEKLNFDSEHIAIMGGSAGGMACFYLLENYNDEFKFFGNCWGAPWSIKPNVTNFPPTVSIHGTADKAVAYELELEIDASFEKAGIPHKLITLEDAPHTPMKYSSTFMPIVLEWLDKYMKN